MSRIPELISKAKNLKKKLPQISAELCLQGD
jgi:hypothetical protein